MPSDVLAPTAAASASMVALASIFDVQTATAAAVFTLCPPATMSEAIAMTHETRSVSVATAAPLVVDIASAWALMYLVGVAMPSDVTAITLSARLSP